MKKDPAFLFYSQDFLTGVTFMSNEQIGIYIKLLCLEHQHGGLIEKASFNTFTNNDDAIKNKFIETEDGFYNHRLMIEMENRSKKCSNLSANAKKRWAIEKQKQCKSNAIASNLHMPIEDEDEDEDEDVNINVNKYIIINKKINFSFEEFWMAYDKKIGDKIKLEKKWIALSDEDRKLIMEYIPKYKLSQPDKKFRKHPDTFFNNKSWHDELIQQTKEITEDGRPIDQNGHVWATKTRRY